MKTGISLLEKEVINRKRDNAKVMVFDLDQRC